MMAIKGAHDREQGNRKIPNNSIDCLFTILKQIQADKRHTANAWVTRTNRVESGFAPRSLPHHRTCRSASGGF